MRKGQKMSPEQYQALRRKIGGTSKYFFKGWVETKGAYVDKVRGGMRGSAGRGWGVKKKRKSFIFFSSSPSLPCSPFFLPLPPKTTTRIIQGYVSDEEDAVSAPPGILFLVLTLVGLGAATAAVVSKVG